MRPFLLVKRGLVEPYLSPQAAGLPPACARADGAWTGVAARARVLLVNRRARPAGESGPRSIRDLADPRWKGRAAIANPLFGTTTMHVAALFARWGDAEARAFLDALKANGVRIASSNGEVKRLVVAGEVAFGLTDTDDANEALKEGADVDVVYPDADGLGHARHAHGRRPDGEGTEPGGRATPRGLPALGRRRAAHGRGGGPHAAAGRGRDPAEREARLRHPCDGGRLRPRGRGDGEDPAVAAAVVRSLGLSLRRREAAGLPRARGDGPRRGLRRPARLARRPGGRVLGHGRRAPAAARGRPRSSSVRSGSPPPSRSSRWGSECRWASSWDGPTRAAAPPRGSSTPSPPSSLPSSSPWAGSTSWEPAASRAASATSRVLFSEAGVVLVLALAFAPIVTSLVAVGLQALDPSLEDAARVAAGPLRAVTRILLPSAAPATALAAIVVFTLAFSELGVPMFLRVEVFPAAVFSRLGGIDYAPGEALALVLPLVPLALLLLAAERRLVGLRSYAVLGLRSPRADRLSLGRWRTAASLALWLAALLSIAPIAGLAAARAVGRRLRPGERLDLPRAPGTASGRRRSRRRSSWRSASSSATPRHGGSPARPSSTPRRSWRS